MKRSFWGAALASTMLLSGSQESLKHSASADGTKLPSNMALVFGNAANTNGKTTPYHASDFIRSIPDFSGTGGFSNPGSSNVQSPLLLDLIITGPSLLDPAFHPNLTGDFRLGDFSRPRLLPQRHIPFINYPAGTMSGHIDGSGLKSLCERTIESAHDRQFLIFADTNHGIPEIHEFTASEDFISTLAANGYKHIFLEIPIFLQDLVDDFAAGKISEEMFNMVSSSVCHMIHATPETLPRFLKANADKIRLANQHGMRVHFIDHGPGDIDPEHADLLNSIYKRQIDVFRNMLEQNPQLMDVQQNIPELAAKVYGIAKERDLRSLGLDELMTFVDAMDWGPEEGGPASQKDRLRYRLLEGDPQLAQNIRNLAGNERAMILYGQWHMTRTSGDLDASLGDENCFVVDLYGNLDQQQPDEEISNLHFIGLLGFTEREDANAAICVATQTLMLPDGTYFVFGQSGPPLHIDACAGNAYAKEPTQQNITGPDNLLADFEIGFFVP
jgi:hypothetical protein